MANVIQGTAVSDLLTGTDGADLIIPGTGNDTVFGGAGNDTIWLQSSDDLTTVGGGSSFNQFDGGTGTNTLRTELLAADNLTGINTSALTTTQTIWGNNEGAFANIQRVEVTNASNAILTVGTASTFVFDDVIASSYGGGATFGASGATNVEGTGFNGAVVAGPGSVAFDATEGVMVNGATVMDGGSFTTAGGGTVTVAHDTGGTNEWQFDYTAAPINTMTLVVLDATTADETKMLGLTTAAGQSVTSTIDFSYDFGANVDLTGNSLGVRVIGSDIPAGNDITSGSGNDTILMNGGANSVDVEGGNNNVWAGPGDDAAFGNTVFVNGAGNNRVGTGSGDDSININGDGANVIFAGAGDDNIDIGGGGDNVVWAGAGDDNIDVNGDGSNQVAGGAGDDSIDVNGGGNNTIYGGAAAGSNTITIDGDGDNLIFGGNSAGVALGAGSNTITLNGTGANEVFNGTGNDNVIINNTATGDNILHGGAGNDTFDFVGDDASATLVFAAGDGNDVIEATDVQLFADDDIQIDLSAFSDQFADADAVINALTDDGAGNISLFITAGQTITFSDASLTLGDFQAANPDNWLIL